MNIFVVRILHTSCCRLIQPVKMYTNWYMMWYLKKDMFCREHTFFRWFVIFKMVCPSSVFRLVWPSSVVQQTRSMWNSFVHLHIFCTQVYFYDHVHNHISNCVHDHTNDLFGRSRVWTPGLAHDLFCGSRVWFPDLAAWSFCGSRVQFPDPITCFRPVVSMAYVTRPHD